jgi:hypothetical protein
MAKKNTLKKASARATLAKVAEEMNRPRFVESARKAAISNGHVRERSSKNAKL